MSPQHPTPLSQLALPCDQQQLLESMWVTTVDELLSIWPTLDTSPDASEQVAAHCGSLGQAVTTAKAKLAPPRVLQLCQAAPARMLGCLVAPEVMERFRIYGRLRQTSVGPEGAFEGSLPPAVRLLDQMPPIRDQGQRGTCVAFASVAMREFLLSSTSDLSEQFLYWACKELDGNPSPGTYIHTAMTALAQYGVCPESVWPYNPQPAGDEGQGPPPDEAFEQARQYQLSSARTVEPNLVVHYKNVLAGDNGQGGMPVTFGTLVFDSWHRSSETRRTGKVTLPWPGEAPVGGHAWCVVGYVDNAAVPGGGYFIVRNSWGLDWAPESTEAPGHALVPYEYVERYAIEAFTGPTGGQETKAADKQRKKSKAEPTDSSRPDSGAGGAGPSAAFPPVRNLSPESAARFRQAEDAKSVFFSAIHENLKGAVGNRLPTEFGPWWWALLPWRPDAVQVSEVACLDAEMTRRVCASSGIASAVGWADDWRLLMEHANGLRIYEVQALGVRIHVVAAFAVGLRPGSGGEPEAAPPDDTAAAWAQQLYHEWLCASRAAKPAAAAMLTIGSSECRGSLGGGTAAGFRWIVRSFRDAEGQWQYSGGETSRESPDLCSFLDRLSPETESEREARIKACVDEQLEAGFEGYLHTSRIAAKTGYRPAQIREAFYSLQATGNYRLRRTPQGLLSITGRASLDGLGPSPRAWRERRLWQQLPTWMAVLTGVSIGLANGWWWLDRGDLRGLLLVLPFAFVGALVSKYLTRFWQEKD